MRATLLATAFAFLFLTNAGDAALVARWNFNTYDGDAHMIASDGGLDPNAELVIDASWPDTDLAAVTGTTDNLFPGDVAGTAIQFSSNANNGTGFQMEVNLTQFKDPVLSFAYNRTGNGFDDVTLSYSINGGIFMGATAVTNPDASYLVHTFDFSAINAFDGASSAVFRLLLAGAVNPSGTADFDNIQINATGTPEPASLAMMGLGICAIVAFGRRRRTGRKTAQSGPRENAAA